MMGGGRSAALLRPVVLAWLAVAILLLAMSVEPIRQAHFPDGDDVLRLVQVRDLMAGQPWFDLHQYRIDPPGGVLMHWSRLVDLPLVLVIAALHPLLGAQAETAALICVPLFTLFAAQFLAARLSVRLFGPDHAWAAAIVLGLMVPVITQMRPLRIDHHGWQIVAVLAALNALVARDQRRAGWLAGSALAAGLSISLELLPLTVLFAGVFAFRWLSNPVERLALVAMLQSLAAVSAALFLATRGLADLASHCDAVSPPYLAVFALAAGLASALALVRTRRPLFVAAWLAAIGLACLGVFLAMAPECTSGPFARLDPVVRQFWYVNVAEGMPIWGHPLAKLAQMLVPPLAGLYAALRLWRTSGQRVWLEYSLLLAGCIAISIAVARFSGVACAVASVPLAWQLRDWLIRSRKLRAPVHLAAALAAFVLLMPGFVIVGIESAAARMIPGSQATAADAPPAPPCTARSSITALAPLPPATVLAPLDIGPAILLDTRHSVVGTAHHRGSAGMRDLITAFIGSPDAARAIARRHGAAYVLTCAGLTEAQNYAAAAPDGLMGRLLANRPPRWLQPVALPASAGGLRLWRVVD